MKKPTLVIVVFCILMILLSFVLFFAPSVFENKNTDLQKVSNFISFLSMFFALLALCIATFAYRVAVLRPNLKLNIIPWMAEKGDIALRVNKETKQIDSTRPLTSWKLEVENNGDVAAKYVVVEIVFDGMYFSNDVFPGWKASHHANALGYYGIQWTSEDKTIVHPHFPVEIPTLYFSSHYLEGEELNIIVTIVADGFKKKVSKIPVRLEYDELV
ncbi:hypothetical protein [Paenibacillus chitinolyticus]|uniref:hypothetical protein n=1 Tax=Paenibacillus chitinolyticus TaxID=79263 RepID=UPI00366341D3